MVNESTHWYRFNRISEVHNEVDVLPYYYLVENTLTCSIPYICPMDDISFSSYLLLSIIKNVTGTLSVSSSDTKKKSLEVITKD